MYIYTNHKRNKRNGTENAEPGTPNKKSNTAVNSSMNDIFVIHKTSSFVQDVFNLSLIEFLRSALVIFARSENWS